MENERTTQRQEMWFDVDPIHSHDGVEGKINQLDFAFLRLKQGQEPSPVFLYPKWDFADEHIAVMGYPGKFY